ncbi:cell wall hydrolase [Octadecabacter sp. 1_MG-2023]|uniref:cell wall hydrolase n=1 Tax=unclassified Octadecabacter TaxID=196158 RepID=UPI001C08B1AD|nr:MULTISPECIES: cell wall hydrolase [unclassified Octadecabacter]MBU2992791.1 cell wall hydrolase [Octadecabacter sp. B2R22]MDO6733758.1 cell wall hydrolase [Octadecabacter sp. 1_MG-2023]
MIKRLGMRICATAVLATSMGIAALAPANADEVLAARLGALLGQERAAIQQVPDASLAALTSVPPASVRNIPTAPDVITYDNAFLATQPAASGGEQWRCLAEALYFEARGESVRGLFAVGEVIMNRVDSHRFPSTLCGVINQGTGRQYACQFTYTCDGAAEVIHEPAAWARVGKVARLLVDGAPRTLTDGATHYHTRAVNPRWARVFPRTTTIGSHHFYRQS